MRWKALRLQTLEKTMEEFHAWLVKKDSFLKSQDQNSVAAERERISIAITLYARYLKECNEAQGARVPATSPGTRA